MIKVYREDLLTLRIDTSWQNCSNKVDKKEQLGWTTELGNIQGEEIVLKRLVTIKGKKEYGANYPNDHPRPLCMCSVVLQHQHYVNATDRWKGGNFSRNV